MISCCCLKKLTGSRLGAGFCLQILQIREGDIVFQIVPGQVGIDLAVCFGNGLFVPYLLGRAAGARNDWRRFFLAAFCLALYLGHRGCFVPRMQLCPVRAGHALLCHKNHLIPSVPQKGQVNPWKKQLLPALRLAHPDDKFQHRPRRSLQLRLGDAVSLAQGLK